MKDQIPTLAMLSALAMMLSALVFLCVYGLKPDTPVLIGLVGGVTGMAGAIGGFSMNAGSGKPPANISNSPGAKVNSDSVTEKE